MIIYICFKTQNVGLVLFHLCIYTRPIQTEQRDSSVDNVSSKNNKNNLLSHIETFYNQFQNEFQN